MLLRKPASALVVNRASVTAARAGFTLMELLVVVAILVVLIGVATPMYLSYLDRSKLRIARVDASRLAGELKNYAAQNDGNYPPENDWSMLPLEKPAVDPWGQTYHWQLIQTTTPDGTETRVPIVWSGGPSGTYGPNDRCSSSYTGQ